MIHHRRRRTVNLLVRCLENRVRNPCIRVLNSLDEHNPTRDHNGEKGDDVENSDDIQNYVPWATHLGVGVGGEHLHVF